MIMRIIGGIIIGLTIPILAFILWKPALGPATAWALTRIPPPTPHGWTPKMRTWINGVEQ